MNDTKELLLDAAELSIRKKGYNAFSFRELADSLKIKSASVHYHFRKKEDLGQALVQRYSSNFFDILNEKSDGMESYGERIEALRQTYRESLYASDSICLCGMLGAEASGLPVELSHQVAGFFKANVDWVIGISPQQWPRDKKHNNAHQIIATLQGAMMIANNLNNPHLFDQATANLSTASEKA